MNDRSFWEYLRLVFAANCAATVLIGVLNIPIRAPGLEAFVLALVDSFIYSNGIGLAVGLALWWFVPRFAPLRSTLGRVALMATILVPAVLVGAGFFVPDRFWGEFLSVGRTRAVLALLFGIGLVLYGTLQLRLSATQLELRTRELAEERSRKLAVEAQLASLAARVHPHFLFNALNSISALIVDDPPRAERLIGRLAVLLRFSLDAGSSGTVPLHQEMRVVAGYLDIEFARLGERLHLTVEWPEQLAQTAVPPLAVQTLVENSVKHAVAPRREGGAVRVLAQPCDGSVRIEVWDDGPGFAGDNFPSGRGLDNLRGRLAALWGSAAALEVDRRGQWTVVALVLPHSKDTQT